MADAHIPGSQIKEAAFPHLFSTSQVVWTAPICSLTMTAFWTVTPFPFSPLRDIPRAVVQHPGVADLLIGLISVAGAGKVMRRGEGAELGRVRPTHRGEARVAETKHARVPKEKDRPRPQPGVVSDQLLLLRQSKSGVEQFFINVVVKCILFAN